MKQFFQIVTIFLLVSCLIFSSCKKESSCETCMGNNKPPIAITGPDKVITFPTDSVLLDGSSSSDPDGRIIAWLWRKISGPASFNINRPTDSVSIVKNLTAGTYKFELEVTDNGSLYAKDTIQVIVDSIPTLNHPPIANAGPDQAIFIPTNSVSLDGSSSSDPDNNIIIYQWSKINGPISLNITNAYGIQTQVNNLLEGIYQFELKVTDAGGLVGRDTVIVTVNQSITSSTFIYVAGQESGVAKYWKNGTAVNLPNGIIANSIYLSENDVYVAGQDYLGNGIYQIAKYWKNGVTVNLTENSSYAGANDICVSGSDVYVAGWESDGFAHAKYWKNSVAFSLPNGGLATGIYVLDNDVYVSGNDTGQIIAKYWKNGIEANLSTNGSGYSMANDIYVSGNDVYVAGFVGEIVDYGGGYWDYGPSTAVYWKNGIAVNLPNGSKANSIYVSGNDVYVAGEEYNGNSNVAIYWKNGVALNLPNGTRAKSIYLNGNDVYVAGDNNGIAKYWKNGVESWVSSYGAVPNSWATSIFIGSR